MYLVNGSVPADQLKAVVERLRRDPPHIGLHIEQVFERKELSVPEAARLLDLPVADLTEVVECRAPMKPELALRMEAAGWASADLWVRLQSSYDLAQARLRREGKSSEHSPLSRAVQVVPPAS